MKTYISVNVVSQSLLFIDCINKNRCHTLEEAAQIKLPLGINFAVSLAFAEQCEWILLSYSKIGISDIGHTILTKFNGESISEELWRIILSQYIAVCQPAWAKRIPYGRKEAYLFMNEEEQRCFSEAGLIDSQDDAVLNWWDALAEIERTKKNEQNNEVGRQGEKLTMLYEEARTGAQPDWRAIETNLAGYDILSQRSAENNERILIEVKSSTQSIQNAFAIITRHEWETATLANNKGRYYFYFWCICASSRMLARITADEMSPHIPVDGKTGLWDNAKIPYSAFSTRFAPVS